MSRPRALVLTPQLPWPLDDGGRIGLHQFTWSVARACDTTLIAMVPPTAAAAVLPPALEVLGVRLVTVPHTPPPAWIAAAHGVFGPWPYTLARYRDTHFHAMLQRLVREVRPTFALINHLHLATYADALEGTALVLREHNVESRWLARYAATRTNPLVRAYAQHQASRMRTAEAQLCERMDLVLAIHDDEARELRQLAPRARIEVVPVALDPERYCAPVRQTPPVVLLTASFGWPPNSEGARRFLAHGWPRVRAAHPQARLRLVGKALPDALAAFARSQGAEAVGYVHDIAPEFAQASALVVPLWAGAGMRVKIVEALFARLPVVSTALGAEGLALESGRDVLLGETPEALGDAIAALLAAPARIDAMAAAGHATAMGRWSLEALAGPMVERCLAVARAAAGSAR